MRMLVALFVLGCGAADVPPHRTAHEAPAEPPGTLEEALRAHAEALCESGPTIELEGSPAGPCDGVEVSSAGEAPLEATIADVTLGGQLWSVLAVRTGDQTLFGALASGWSPGVGGHSVEGTSTVEAIDLLSGGAPEIHARFSGVAGDSDMGSCDHRGRETEVHVLCSVDGGALRCVAVESTSLRTREHTLCNGSAPDDGEPVPDELEIHVREGYALTVGLRSDVVTFTPTPGDTVTPPITGDVAAADLVARDDLAWPAHFETVELFAN